MFNLPPPARASTHASIILLLGLPALVGQTMAPASSEAETILQLDDVVITATRTERPVDLTPGTVKSVNLLDETAADLRAAIRDDPMIAVPFTTYGTGIAYSRGGFRSVNIRGVEGNRVLLLVDGIRLPDEFMLGGSEPLGRDYLDPDMLKRVEILHGSASATAFSEHERRTEPGFNAAVSLTLLY